MSPINRASDLPMTQVKRVSGHAVCSVRTIGTAWHVSPSDESRRMHTERGGGSASNIAAVGLRSTNE